MATGITSWSKTAANNATADSAGPFPEGMAPSAVNDGVRGLMASGAKYRDDVNGSLVTSGSSTAYTVTSNQVFGSLAALDGQTITITMDETSGATPTLAVDGLTAKPIRHATGATLPTGALLAGSVYRLTYGNSVGEFLIQDQLAVLPASLVTTAALADESVTNAKLADMANATLKGRATSGTGVPEDLTIGAGLRLNGTTILSAYPPSGSFAGLSIKVATNTTITAAADYVTMSDGTSFVTLPVSGTINMATTGANALDAGSIAAATWYAIFAIAKADGATAWLASTSGSSPTLPTDYIYKARMGWVRTAASTAQLLGTWQLGRRAQYKPGLAQTTAIPTIATNTATSYTAKSVVDFVPSTASEITVSLTSNTPTAITAAAPNGSYGTSYPTNTPPIYWGGGSDSNPFACGSFVLEGADIYVAQIGGGGVGTYFCHGWVDNI